MPRPADIISHRYTIWFILALPALRMLWPILADQQIPPRFLVGSGEWAVRLLILTLALTPLQRIFRKSKLVFWFARRRRYFGLASFAYALIHVGFYLFDMFMSWGTGALTWILFSAGNLYALAGWVGFLIFIPLAATSNRLSQMRLGRWWKILQRAAYVAALAIALHWLLLAGDWQTWVQVGILVVLELVRIGLFFRQKRAPRSR